MKLENKYQLVKFASLIMFGILIGHELFEENYNYNFEPIIVTEKYILDNSNVSPNKKVIDINCTEGVKVIVRKDSFYLSTWGSDAEVKYGECTVNYLDVKVVKEE